MSEIEQLGNALTADAVALILAAAVLAYFCFIQIMFWTSDRREKKREREKARRFAQTLKLARRADERSRN
jgi:uncharacterized protein (DUF2062 family)